MPNRATPSTRMMMPSLLSQFVPNVSSRANTDFMRCWAVGLGALDRSGANCGGSSTRAPAGGGVTRGGNGACGGSILGGAAAVLCLVGGTGTAGRGDCGGIVGVEVAAS